MKTKLLHQFREEFLKSIKLEVSFYLDGSLSMDITTPFWNKSMGSFIHSILHLDPNKVGAILTHQDYQELVDEMYDNPREVLKHLYQRFMFDKIKQYKKEHPYRGIRVRVFYRKRR